MAFDAGAVIGHFTLDSSGWTAGADKVQKSTENLTGSIFKGNLAYDAFKKVLAFVKDQLVESVKAYTEHEQIVAQTNAVIKSTADASGISAAGIENLAKSMSDLTGIDEDVIQSAENILLTFTNIGKNTFPQATATVLDMSVALKEDLNSASIQVGKALQDPILGVTALSRVGVQFTQTQKDVIKQLVDTGQVAKAQQIILGELNKEFGGSAAAARDTFGGALSNLKVQIEDVQKGVGMYITTVGKPFVEVTGQMAKGIADFLTSSEGIAKIQSVLVPIVASFTVLFNIVKIFFDYIMQFAKGVIQDVVKGFTDLVGKGNEGNTIFLVLGYTVKTVGIVFTVLGKIIGGVIQYTFDLIKIVKDSVVTLVDFGKAMADPFNKDKWAQVGKDVTQTWTSIKDTGIHIFDTVKDTIKTTYDQFASLGTEAPKVGAQLQTSYGDATDAMNESFAKLRANLAGTSTEIANTGTVAQNTITDIAAYVKEIEKGSSLASLYMLQYGKTSTIALVDTQKSWGETFDQLKQDMLDTVTQFGVFSDQGVASINKLLQHVQGLVGNITNSVSQAFNGITAIYDQSLQNQQTLADNDYNKKKAYITAHVTDATEQAAQLSALDAEYNAKSAEIKTKQFESQKAASIVNATIAGINAIMTSFAQFGWPFGLIPAAIMAGITAVQVGMIAAQPTPDFSAATGGMFPGGSNILVGEKGPEVAHFGQPVQIVPNDKSVANGVQVSAKFYGDINSQVDMDQASLQLAARVRRAARAI